MAMQILRLTWLFAASVIAAAQATSVSYTSTTFSLNATSAPVASSVVPLEGCYKVVSTATSAIAPGTYTYCQCNGGETSGIKNITVGSTTYEVCDGAPEPTVDSSSLSPPNFNITEPNGPRPYELLDLDSIPACAANTWLLSADCMAAINKNVSASNGRLLIDGLCSDTQKVKIRNGAWEANQLLEAARGFVDQRNIPGSNIIRYWFGDDYFDWTNDIQASIKRAADWYEKTNILLTLHCHDPKEFCKTKKGGKTIGGYAWTEGVIWNNYHIVFCDPFYTANTLSETVEWLAKEKAVSNDNFLKYAKDANWLKTHGYFFMHEMFHLGFVDDVPENHHRHITDVYTRNFVDDNPDIGTRTWAYGPLPVWQLARNLGIAKGGGAPWSSINADSYVQAVNAVYWLKRNKVLPQVPGRDYFAANWTNIDSNGTTDPLAPPTPIVVQLGNMTGNNNFSGAFELAAATWFI